MKIYYEVVDLGVNGYSPLSFRDANGIPAYVKSERYVLLQTYVFKNLHATQDINNLEFYQMLHGHAATQTLPASEWHGFVKAMKS